MKPNIIIECVPNYSEGRRSEVIEALSDSIRKQDGVKLLDYSSDKDHNRSVFTFIGDPLGVKNAIFASFETALKHIEIEKHQGGHPRIGAMDVVPLIPIKNITMEETVALAREIGKELAEKYDLPVYLYEDAALKPTRRNLEEIRKGNYEGLKEAMNQPERAPDFGPHQMHPLAGASVVGARRPLIAFNVNLASTDVKIAKAIAKRLRFKTGGLAKVKAIGLAIEEKNMVQVSMNLVDYTMTAIYTAFEMVKMEARRYGVAVLGSELIGLLPQEALVEVGKYYLQLEDFSSRQIIESHLTD